MSGLPLSLLCDHSEVVSMVRPRRRRNRVLAAVACVVAILLATPRAQAARSADSVLKEAGPCAVTKQSDVPDRMRDGTVLSADVYRPQVSGKVPVVLMRTQYGKNGPPNQPTRFLSPAWLAAQCYMVVVEDVRGQYASKGTFYEFKQDLNDGYDSVEWAARLPGSNGLVGMYGSSYVGAVQWLAAEAAPPHLVTIVPFNTASDYYEGWTYEGGEFRLGFIENWSMETIVPTAAANRGDTALADRLHTDYHDIARWMTYRPYDTSAATGTPRGSSATGSSPRSLRPAASRPTTTPTTRATRSPRRAGTPAVRTAAGSRGRTTSRRSRHGRTCSSTPARR
jgi:putative CocE/NonD family hydrolase